ncbi:MAG TPA: lipopolysaccharide heptosyltransferase I [Verrucomicrobiales bacterium]|nr:lipopolysaccharide heptosyltransferase I [Verrucomicrobiales bacterium]
MNILIIKLSALGDVVHTLPALNALRRHHPDAHISWLVEEAAKDLVEGHPALDRVIVWPRRRFEQAFKSGRLVTAWRLFAETRRQLRQLPFDLAIDFQGLMKSGLWMAQASSRRKAGFGPGMQRSEGSHFFLNEKVPAVSMEIHALERGLRLLNALGVPTGPVEYRLPVRPEAYQAVEDFLSSIRVKPEDTLVAIHPFTRWETKHWFNDRFAAVADALIDQGKKAVFTGGPADGAKLDDIAGRMKHPMLRADRLGGLPQLAALLERATAMITTDTGPMHIAAAMGTPVVAIFGPTSPQRTGPHGEQHVVLHSGVPCSPCFRKDCLTNLVEPMGCMKRISVEAVLEAVVRIGSPARAFTGTKA